MSRPPKVSIFQKWKTWYVRFPKDGSRIKKSCKTASEETAKQIARDITYLFVDPNTMVHPVAYEIFHGEKPLIESKVYKPHIYRQLSKYSETETEEYIIGDLAKRIEDLEIEVNELKQERDNWKLKYEAVSNRLEGKMIAEQSSLPTLKEALALYEEDIKHLKRYKTNYFNFIEKFFEDVVGIDTKIDKVTPLQIRNCLVEDAKEESENPEDRWNRKRGMFTKFFNWATGLWSFIDPCDKVQTKKEDEREDPDWHEIPTVLKVIEMQDTYYQKAMVETLFFTGTIASEFRGLKLTDYYETKGKWYIRIAPNEYRNIKAGKRRRSIPVIDRLKSVLDEYIEKHHPGGPALFPPLIKRGKKDIWNEGTLSRYMQDECKFKKFTDMDCKSTRRTYGSIMLRLGYTIAEVASLMGNSIRTAEKHYSRIIANEVDMSKHKKEFDKLIKAGNKKPKKKS